GYLEHEALAAVLGLERIEDRGQVAVELHVDDGAHHLADTTCYVGCHCASLVPRLFYPCGCLLNSARPRRRGVSCRGLSPASIVRLAPALADDWIPGTRPGMTTIRLLFAVIGYSASAPEMISISSLVMLAWRARL